MQHTSLEDRLTRLEKIFAAKSKSRRLFEADDEDDVAVPNDKELDKAANDPDVQSKIDVISKSLKDAGLAEYVANVNDMMSDEKGRLALELVAGTLTDDQLTKLGLNLIFSKPSIALSSLVKSFVRIWKDLSAESSLPSLIKNFLQPLR